MLECLVTFTKEYLAQTLLKFEKDFTSKTKALKKENETLQNSCENL